MAFVLVNSGKAEELLSLTDNNVYAFRLLQSDPKFSRTTTLAECEARECTYVGYLEQNAAGWTPPSIDTSNFAFSEAAPLNWRALNGGNPQDVYGYFVVDQNDILLGGEIFPTGPIAMRTAGATFSFTPRLSLGAVTMN